MTYERTAPRRRGLAGVSVATPTGWVGVTPAPGQAFAAVGLGDASKVRTARAVATLAKVSQFDPLVIDTAQELALTARERDADGICLAIRGFLARHFTFVEDVRDADAVREPRQQLEFYYSGAGMRGDCDCCAALGAALGLAVGRDAQLVLLAFNDPAEEYTHIYAELEGTGHWIDLDTTKPAGAIPPVSRILTVPV